MFHALSPGARQPVLGTQLVEQRSLHAQLAIGLETHTTFGVESDDGIHQNDVSCGDQIPAIDAARKAHGKAACHGPGKALIDLHESVARFVAGIRVVALPELVHLFLRVANWLIASPAGPFRFLARLLGPLHHLGIRRLRDLGGRRGSLRCARCGERMLRGANACARCWLHGMHDALGHRYRIHRCCFRFVQVRLCVACAARCGVLHVLDRLLNRGSKRLVKRRDATSMRFFALSRACESTLRLHSPNGGLIRVSTARNSREGNNKTFFVLWSRNTTRVPTQTLIPTVYRPSRGAHHRLDNRVQ